MNNWVNFYTKKGDLYYLVSFGFFSVFSFFLFFYFRDKIGLVVIPFFTISAFVITFYNLETSIHNSLMIYSIFAKIFHLKNPNVNYIDESGIPYVDFGYKNGKYVGIQRNPLTISNKADWYYSTYLKTKEQKFYHFFMNCLAALEQIREENKMDVIEYELYPYSFVTDDRYQDCPWYSAMAQSAISVTFLKAYDLTKEKKYIIHSDLAINALRVPIKNGGVLDIDPKDGGYWFEEVASKNKIETKTNILNGHLFCILDLLVYQKTRPYDYINDMIKKSITEVKTHIHDYDLGYWTYYDRAKHFAFDYHYIHVKLFKELFQETNDPFFELIYKKWRFYLPFNPLWARKRTIAYTINLIICFFIGEIFFYSLMQHNFYFYFTNLLYFT